MSRGSKQTFIHTTIQQHSRATGIAVKAVGKALAKDRAGIALAVRLPQAIVVENLFGRTDLLQRACCCRLVEQQDGGDDGQPMTAAGSSHCSGRVCLVPLSLASAALRWLRML